MTKHKPTKPQLAALAELARINATGKTASAAVMPCNKAMLQRLLDAGLLHSAEPYAHAFHKLTITDAGRRALAPQQAATKARKFTPYRVVPGADPMVQQMFARANAKGVSRNELGAKSGVDRSLFRSWEDGARPRVDMLGACIQALGGTLEVKW